MTDPSVFGKLRRWGPRVQLRLDELQDALWDKVLDGDLRTVAAIVRIILARPACSDSTSPNEA